MPTTITQGYGVPPPPPERPYPTAAELQAFALAAGLVGAQDDHLDYARALAAATLRWEGDTGRRGIWSYAADCPEDVALAILSLGASILAGGKAAAGGGVGAIAKLRQDDVEIEYSGTSTATAHYGAQQLQMMDVYADAVRRRRRVVVA